MGDHDQGSPKFGERSLQGLPAFDVEVVGRFIQEKGVAGERKEPSQAQPTSFSPTQQLDFPVNVFAPETEKRSKTPQLLVSPAGFSPARTSCAVRWSGSNFPSWAK